MFTQEFNDIIKLFELIISAISLIAVLLGVVLPLKQAVKLHEMERKNEQQQEKRNRKIQLLDEQISKYYGPISSIIKELSIMRRRIQEQIGRNTIFENGQDKLGDLSIEDQLIWKHFVDNYKIPMQHEILEIMRYNKHLAVQTDLDVCVDVFLEYVLGWELLDSQKRNGVPNYYEYYYCYNYPKQFNDHINKTLSMLIEEKNSLIKQIDV